MPHPNILTCRDVGIAMWQIFVGWWWLTAIYDFLFGKFGIHMQFRYRGSIEYCGFVVPISGIAQHYSACRLVGRAGLRHVRGVRGVRPNRAADFRGAAILAFILPIIAMLTKEPEMLQPDAFCERTTQQNATAGSLQRSLRPLAGFKGVTSRRGGEEGWEGRGRERGRA